MYMKDGVEMNEKLIIGSHVGFSGNSQLLGSIKEALSYGSNTFMFYTGAPQNTKRNPIKSEFTNEAYKLMKDNNIDLSKVVIHAPYIVNLGNLDNFDFSVEFLKGELSRANALGIKNVVLHPGSSVAYDRNDSIESIIKGLNIILDNDIDVTICLETMAGKGTEIGINIAEIKTIIDGVKFKDKIGACLDTCHLNDSGVDLTKFDEYINEFDKEIGINYIKVIHINDSKNVLGSHKDRHENIGLGTIGFDTLLKIIYDDRFKDIPKILETPYVTASDESKEKIYPPYKYEIAMIKNKTFDNNLLAKIRSNE